MQRDDQKFDVFEITKRMAKTNQDIKNQCYIMMMLLKVSDRHEISWKSYYEKLLNTQFTQDRNSLSHTDTFSGVHRLIDQEMVRADQ